MKSTLTTDEDINKFFAPSNEKAKEFLEKEKKYLWIGIEHNKLQVNDLRFKDFAYYLDYQDIKINNLSANVMLIESADIYFSATPQIKSQMTGLQHTINLEKHNDHWFIVEDFYYDDLKMTVANYMKKAKSLDEAKTLILNDSLNESNDIKQKIKEMKTSKSRKESINQTNDQTVGIAATRYYIDRVTAVKYARDNALIINPQWGNYESMGGDCTNFTSQCLYNGKVPFDSSGTYKWYWYSDSNRVPPWTGATEFRQYALGNNSATTNNYGLYAKASSWGYVIQSDIVQLGGSSPYHSMFISAIVADLYDNITDYLICQHSTSAQERLKDYPLSSKAGTKSYISIEGYYK